MTAMNPTLSRALALMLLAAALFIAWAGVFGPIAGGYFSGHGEIQRLRKDIASLESLRVRLGDPESWRAASEDAANAQPEFIDAPSENIAGAALQAQLRALVEGAGGRLQSSQISAGTTESPLSFVSVRVAFTCSMDQLRAALYAVETGRPVMSVDRVQLRQPAGKQDSSEIYVIIDVRAAYASGWPE